FRWLPRSAAPYRHHSGGHGYSRSGYRRSGCSGSQEGGSSGLPEPEWRVRLHPCRHPAGGSSSATAYTRGTASQGEAWPVTRLSVRTVEKGGFCCPFLCFAGCPSAFKKGNPPCKLPSLLNYNPVQHPCLDIGR